MIARLSTPFFKYPIQKSCSSSASMSTGALSPKSYTPETALRVAIPLVVGLLSSNILPTCIPQLITDMVFAGLATCVAQPIVNSKLGSQTESREVVVYDSKLKAPLMFLAEDTKSFGRNLKRVVANKGACDGLAAYASKNAISKSLTLFGFEMIKPLADANCPFLPDLTRTIMAGMASGLIQSPITAPLEWSSSLHSKYPDMSYKDQAKFMLEHLKNKTTMPITTVAVRSAIFDGVFNTLHHDYGVSFGPASLASITLSYPAEIKRAQHQTDMADGETTKKSNDSDNESSQNVFQGLISRSMEAVAVFTLFQFFRDQHNERKKENPSHDVVSHSISVPM